MNVAATAAALASRPLPYRIAWGAEIETIDTSFTPPHSLDELDKQLGHLWGFMIGSARLGDEAVNHYLLRHGVEKIDRAFVPGYLTYPFLESLLFNASQPLKASVIKRVMKQNLPGSVLQPFMLMAWRMWHVSVLHAAGWNESVVVGWLRKCDFQNPASREMRLAVQLGMLDDVMTVWRGGYGLTPAELANGISWTPNRATAAYFATRLRKGGGSDPSLGPVVISRQIARSEVLFSDFRTPAEIVVAPSDSWATDTNPHDWETLGRAFGRLIEQMVEMARPELDSLEHRASEAKLDCFLRALGKSREDLERAIGRKVRLAGGNAAHA